MRTHYKNDFGQAVLKPVSPIMPVSDISAASCPTAEANKIDFNMAEQLALITENRGIQVCFASFDIIYVIAHETPSTASICAVSIVEFKCEASSACEQLANEAQKMTAQHLHFI